MTLTSGILLSAGQANLNMKNISYFLCPSAKAPKKKKKKNRELYIEKINKTE